jgi:hypothetical protein
MQSTSQDTRHKTQRPALYRQRVAEDALLVYFLALSQLVHLVPH